MIKIYSGETLIMPIEISGVTDLIGAKLVFSAINRETGTEIRKTPAVDGLIVTAELTSAETLTPGLYTLEFRGVFSGITKVIDYYTLLIKHANIKEVIDNG